MYLHTGEERPTDVDSLKALSSQHTEFYGVSGAYKISVSDDGKGFELIDNAHGNWNGDIAIYPTERECLEHILRLETEFYVYLDNLPIKTEEQRLKEFDETISMLRHVGELGKQSMKEYGWGNFGVKKGEYLNTGASR